MQKKVVAIVVLMVSLCSCYIFLDGSTTEKVFNAFISMYAPTSNDESKTVMYFNSEADIYPEIPKNQIADNAIYNNNQSVNRITGVAAYK